MKIFKSKREVKFFLALLFMTHRQKQIVNEFRKRYKGMKHDSDQEILLYLTELKKCYPTINFDFWMRKKRTFFS